jgi:hypothetical protein
MEVFMKKVLLALGALAIVPVCSAEDGDAAEARIEEDHPAYEGWYAGAGFHAANVGVKNEFVHGSMERYDSFSFTAGQIAYVDSLARNEAPPAPLNAYTQAGGPNGSGDVVSVPDANPGFVETEVNDNKTRLGGSIVLGFGKKMKSSPAYFGIEAGLDVAPNTVSHAADKLSERGRAYTITTSVNGIVPSLALRVGFVDCETKILTYIRAGGSCIKAKEHYDEYSAVRILDMASSDNKVSSVVPVVALGIEKAFARKMTGRLELAYRFDKNKVKEFSGDHGSTKLTSKGAISLRALFCAHLKVGA